MKGKRIILICSLFSAIVMFGCGNSTIKQLTMDDIKTYSNSMNNDPLSGDITLNGKIITLPVDVKELTNMKFSFTDYFTKDQELESGYYVDGISMDGNKMDKNTRISVTIYNNSATSVSLENAKIGEINIEKNSEAYKNTAVLPRGITLQSSYDDVIKAYGMPQCNNMSDENSITYVAADNVDNLGRELRIVFDEGTKVINSIKLKNIPVQ